LQEVSQKMITVIIVSHLFNNLAIVLRFAIVKDSLIYFAI